jgi:catecholate siderophore receptor
VQHDLSLGLELTREEQTNYGLATSGSVPNRVSVYNPDASVTLPAYVRNGADSKGKTDTVALYAFDAEVQRPVAGQSGSAPGPLQDLVQRHGGLRGHLDHPALQQQPVGTVVPTTSDGLSKSGTLLSWKAGLLYKPAPNGSVYLNYALSQQPPGGSNFALSAAVNNAANPNMDPQKAKTLELGSKWELAEKNLMLSGALFRTEVTNEIVTNSDGTVGQTGKKIVQGLELGVIGQIKGLGRERGLHRAEHQGRHRRPGGSRRQQRPDLYAQECLQPVEHLPAALRPDGSAAARAMRAASSAAPTVPWARPTTDAYWVFDAMASYRVNKNLDIQLNVFNLFDKDYVAAINKSGYRYFPGIARSARLTANFKF